MEAANTDLLPGTLDMLVLTTLAAGPAHGYAISQSLRNQSGGALEVEQGSLYPALYRMEKKGWIKSKWTVSDTNRKVKAYRLTPAGKRNANAEQASWAAFVAAVSGVVKGA
jgi:PadR family transcriptional regulator PadR